MTAPQRDGPEARRARRRVIALLLARGDIGARLLREAEGTQLSADGRVAGPEPPGDTGPRHGVDLSDRPDGLAQAG